MAFERSGRYVAAGVVTVVAVLIYVIVAARVEQLTKSTGDAILLTELSVDA